MKRQGQFGSEEARARLPEILEMAHNGKSTIITRHGKPYAAVVPVRDMPRQGSSLLALAGTGRGLWGANSAAVIAKMRDEWR